MCRRWKKSNTQIALEFYQHSLFFLIRCVPILMNLHDPQLRWEEYFWLAQKHKFKRNDRAVLKKFEIYTLF
jgi:hypothetical protein